MTGGLSEGGGRASSAGVYVPEEVGGVRQTELAAVLVTLGFDLLGMHRLQGDGVKASHGVVSWKFSAMSRDGKYELGYVLARWKDWAWLTSSETTDPLAFIITAFHNRRRLMDQVMQQCALVAIQHGPRWALCRKDASESVEAAVMRHLKGGR